MPASPAQLLERAVDRPVTVVLKDGRRLTGRLLGVDEHLNIALTDVEETTESTSRRIGRVVVRGSSIGGLFVADGPKGG
jgi:small nuclear ribonucleoprotein (snRNP)-like protein